MGWTCKKLCRVVHWRSFSNPFLSSACVCPSLFRERDISDINSLWLNGEQRKNGFMIFMMSFYDSELEDELDSRMQLRGAKRETKIFDTIWCPSLFSFPSLIKQLDKKNTTRNCPSVLFINSAVYCLWICPDKRQIVEWGRKRGAF